MVSDLSPPLPLLAGFVALPPQRLLDSTVLRRLASRLVVEYFDGGCGILLRFTVPAIYTDGSVLAVKCGGRAGFKNVLVVLLAYT